MKYTFRNLLADFGSSPGAGTNYSSASLFILIANNIDISAVKTANPGIELESSSLEQYHNMGL